MLKLRRKLETILASGCGATPRPQFSADYESNIKGLYIIGDLAGAPVIKLALAQAFDVVRQLAGRVELQDPKRDRSILDILVVGAGAAGLNAALAAQDQGLSCLVLEKEKIANTIENFPQGKWVYAEPDAVPPKGKLWLDGARKEDLVERWHQIVRDNQLDVRTQEPLEGLDNLPDGTFRARTCRGQYLARKVLLAIGQRGNPRKLGVPGEDLEQVYHRLYAPRRYQEENILVVGGGNSAVEAALLLAEQNHVTLSYRGGEFSRLFKDNRRRLDQARTDERLESILQSRVTEFVPGRAMLEIDGPGGKKQRALDIDHAFVLIGAEPPRKFLRALGVKMENSWDGSPLRALVLVIVTLLGLWLLGGVFMPDPAARARVVGGLCAAAAVGVLIGCGSRGDRWAWLGLSFLACYTIYGVKVGPGKELWPYTGWGYHALSFFGRPWAFWYTVLYCLVMLVFGLQALKRWGLERKDKFQIWRYVSLIGFQLVFFFLIPEVLFRWAVRYQWVGAALAHDPQFAQQAWRAYGIVYAWPLFFYTFFYDPHIIWILWGVVLSFVIIPVFVLFQGKRYCSWICGCGGLAETFGDRWRHLAPKGSGALKWESMNTVVLACAYAVTFLVLFKDSVAVFGAPARVGLGLYSVLVDIWLVGIVPVTLYPFLGGKVWCRYWCPLAKLMQLISRFFTVRGKSHFHIWANDKCIACQECSRYCQVGIDVMRYALKQQPLDNATSSCIGCGICVTVCPMDVLSFSRPVLPETMADPPPPYPYRRVPKAPRG